MSGPYPGVYLKRVLNKRHYKSSATNMGIGLVWGTWQWSSKHTGKFWAITQENTKFPTLKL